MFSCSMDGMVLEQNLHVSYIHLIINELYLFIIDRNLAFDFIRMRMQFFFSPLQTSSRRMDLLYNLGLVHLSQISRISQW